MSPTSQVTSDSGTSKRNIIFPTVERLNRIEDWRGREGCFFLVTQMNTSYHSTIMQFLFSLLFLGLVPKVNLWHNKGFKRGSQELPTIAFLREWTTQDSFLLPTPETTMTEVKWERDQESWSIGFRNLSLRQNRRDEGNILSWGRALYSNPQWLGFRIPQWFRWERHRQKGS